MSGVGGKDPRQRARGARAALLVWILALVLLSPNQPAAVDGPEPPCAGAPPFPAYAEIDAVPNVQAWSGDDLGRKSDWRPPPCTGWTMSDFTTLVALAARFHHHGGVDDLLARFGAISELTDVSYWSVSKTRWRDLVEEAYAVTGGASEGGDGSKPRGDFSAAELRAAREVYLYQDDTGPAGGAIYRMRLLELEPTRLVVTFENVTAVKMLFMEVFAPGTLQSVYFLDLLASDEEIWGFYSLTRGTIAEIGGLLVPRQTASYLNRAAAVYRHVAGIPTDREPPVAP
jgi:hypothetical protein